MPCILTSQITEPYYIATLNFFLAKSHTHVEKTVLVLKVKSDVKDAEREEIVQTLKDTMVSKSGSQIKPEIVVRISYHV